MPLKNAPTSENLSPGSSMTFQTSSWFGNAHDFMINGSTMIDQSNRNALNESIKILSENSLPGAEFNSAARSPPPSCHPGTRVDITDNILLRLSNLDRERRVVWLQGPAGVGKSAIMQTIAERVEIESDSLLGATVFFSKFNQRNDLQRAFITVADQLAVQHSAYRSYVTELLATNPGLVKKSMSEQFRRLIQKPFVETNILEELPKTVLILLDGLDECDDKQEQRDLVLTIGHFMLQHETTPLFWIIASRPEPHIRAAFSHQYMQSAHEEIGVPIDSPQACLDVEKYLWDEFQEIRGRFPLSFESPTGQWPAEIQLVKIAAKAAGLFLFASIIIRYVGDMDYGNPISRLRKVVDVVEHSSTTDDNPFAILDALYTDILSSVPQEMFPDTRKLLMFLLPFIWTPNFNFSCNLCGLSQESAYGALHKLHSVLDIPQPEKASVQRLRPFHISFVDYLTSKSRSGEFFIDQPEARDNIFSMCCRALTQAHNPAQSAIQTSRIKIYWAHANQQLKLQDFLFTNSYERLFTISKTLGTSPGMLHDFTRLSSYFRDFDFTEPRVFRRLHEILSSPLRSHLEGWNIIQATLISSFDINLIGLRARTLIVCLKRRKDQYRFLQRGLEWGKSNLTPVGSSYNNFIRSIGHGNEDDRRTQLLALGEDQGWKAHVWAHLTSLKISYPSNPVIFFGTGDKCCALIEVRDSEEFWVYVLPYNRI